MPLWIAVCGFIGFGVLGFIVAAILGNGKVADLERQNYELRMDLYEYQASHGFDKVKG